MGMPDAAVNAEGPFGFVGELYELRLTIATRAGLQPIARNTDTHRLPGLWKIVQERSYGDSYLGTIISRFKNGIIDPLSTSSSAVNMKRTHTNRELADNPP